MITTTQDDASKFENYSKKYDQVSEEIDSLVQLETKTADVERKIAELHKERNVIIAWFNGHNRSLKTLVFIIVISCSNFIMGQNLNIDSFLGLTKSEIELKLKSNTSLSKAPDNTALKLKYQIIDAVNKNAVGITFLFDENETVNPKCLVINYYFKPEGLYDVIKELLIKYETMTELSGKPYFHNKISLGTIEPVNNGYQKITYLKADPWKK